MGTLKVGFWDCPQCKRKGIDGLTYTCPGCGRARGENVTFYRTNNMKTVPTDKLDKATRKPDWYCNYCDSFNSDNDKVCRSCGSPRQSNSKTYFEKRQEKHRKQSYTFDDSSDKEDYTPHNDTHDTHSSASTGFAPSTEYDKSYLGSKSASDYYRTSYEQSSRLDNSEPERKNNYDFTTTRRNIAERTNSQSIFSNLGEWLINHWKLILIVFLAALLIVGIAWLIVEANKPFGFTVTDKTWTRSIEVEVHKWVREDGWSLPSGARLAYTQEEVRDRKRVIDHYETIIEKVPVEVPDGYDEHTVYHDLGNGLFDEETIRTPKTKIIYKDEPHEEPVYVWVDIYDTKYYYDIMRWVHQRVETSSGHDNAPYDPVVTLGENERTGAKTESYTLYGYLSEKGDNKTKSYQISYSLWNEIEIGDSLIIKTTFGTITEIVSRNE